MAKYNLEAYINGIGVISPQNSLNGFDALAEPRIVNTAEVKCIEPNYKAYVSGGVARRMSRMVKMGVVSALTALKDAGLETPDAIMTGTAMGCLQDTEKFLNAIIANDEQFLTPTSFIQSTHNTLGAQIALFLKCNKYNFTYVQRAFSFENAVIDALMKIQEGAGQNVLVGGHDEMTKGFHTLYDRVDYWKKNEGETILNASSNGAYSGEGAAFFVLSKEENTNSYAKLKGVKMLYKPKSTAEIEQAIKSFLEEENTTISDIDTVFYGINGDQRFDPTYHEIRKKLFSEQAAAYFKHLSGEYATSSSFALYLAANCIKNKAVPASVRMDAKVQKQPRNVLIINGFMGENFSLSLLGEC